MRTQDFYQTNPLKNLEKGVDNNLTVGFNEGMKTKCILTDGLNVASIKEMDAFELIQANKEAYDHTDGNYSWCIDDGQPGLVEFDVVCASHDGSISRNEVFRAPDADFVRIYLGSVWSFVHVSEMLPA